MELWGFALLERRNTFLLMGMSLLMLMQIEIGLPLAFSALLALVWVNRHDFLKGIEKVSCYFLFILYGLIVSISQNNQIGALLIIGVLAFVVLMAVYRQLINGAGLLGILKGYVYVSIVLGLISLWQYFLFVIEKDLGFLHIFTAKTFIFRAEATFNNANYYGLFTIFAVLITVYLMALYNNRKAFLMGSLSILMNAVGMILTASRMLYPALVIGALILIYTIQDKRWIKLYLSSLLSMAFVFMIEPNIMPRVSKLSYALFDRLEIWLVGFKIFTKSPLIGHGMMGYMQNNDLYATYDKIHAHNLFLNSAIDFGLIGVGILLALFVPYIVRIINEWVNEEEHLELGLILSLISVVLIHGLVDVAILWPQTAFVLLSIVTVPKNVWRELRYLVKLEKSA